MNFKVAMNFKNKIRCDELEKLEIFVANLQNIRQ